MKIFLNGKFDNIHPGHYNLLVYARTLAGRHGKVTMAIDTGRRIEEMTGKKPLFGEIERAYNLVHLTYPYQDTTLKLIDGVYFFDTDQELLDLINSERPFYLIKGNDWEGKHVIGEDIVNVLFHHSDYKFHNTDIEKRIIDRYVNQAV